MLPRVSSVAWTAEAGGGDDEALSWPRSEVGSGEDTVFVGQSHSTSFRSTLDDHNWYVHVMAGVTHRHDEIQNLDGFEPHRSTAVSDVFHQPLSSLLGSVCSNPFVAGLDFEPPLFLENPNPVENASNLIPGSGFGALTQVGTVNFDFGGRVAENPSFGSPNFSTMDVRGFLNRPKILRPLEVFPPVGGQPTLFQKRAALRQNSSLGIPPTLSNSGAVCAGENKKSDEDLFDEPSVIGSVLYYDSDEMAENKVEEKGGGCGMVHSGSFLNADMPSGDDGEQKGKKKKGLPAKNLMAERRRRKKLNDRLYMLRSVVPKISKMDRASILVDAVEYVKELLQKINDLQNELESTPNSSVTGTPSFHPLTPTPPTLPCRVKEEICPSSLPSPNTQPARVEVKVREGQAVDIHMVCARRPGLLLSTMRALDGLGLDIHQAVISCFNGFVMDVFRAEQFKDGPGVLPEEIKAVLVQSAGIHAAM